MTLVSRTLAATAAAALALPPVAAAAQQACVTEAEVSAVAIYSVPSVVEAVKLKCAGRLASDGYLARRGDALSGRYAALQARNWPRAKSGLLKVLGSQSGAQGRQTIDTIRSLPDNAVRPLVDALLVQEVSAKIPTRNCGRIELVMEALAPIDPEIAGTLIGRVVGLVDPEQMPICPRR